MISQKPRRTSRARRQRGVSFAELVLTLGLAGLMAGFAASALNRRAMNLTAAAEGLMGSLRLARANATSRGAHYRVSFTASSYTVERLQDDDGDGVWVPEGNPLVVDLPAGVSLTNGAGEDVEFDTRGLLAEEPDGSLPPLLTLRLEDGARFREIEVWPSGQVTPVS
jgi:hypothetical protein